MQANAYATVRNTAPLHLALASLRLSSSNCLLMASPTSAMNSKGSIPSPFVGISSDVFLVLGEQVGEPAIPPTLYTNVLLARSCRRHLPPMTDEIRSCRRLLVSPPQEPARVISAAALNTVRSCFRPKGLQGVSQWFHQMAEETAASSDKVLRVAVGSGTSGKSAFSLITVEC